MTTIVTRSGKGSPLTHTEVDTNFVNLNTAKLETAAIPLGTLQAPSVSFLNDSDTGIFCPQGGNSLAIATGGQYAITCTSTQAVGIQTANPNAALHVAGNARVGADDVTDAVLEIGAGASGNRNSYIDIVADTTYTDYGLRIIRNNTGANATSELKHRGTGALNFTTQEAAPIVFNTTNSPALTITSGGLVGIGTSSPTEALHVVGSAILTGAVSVGTTASATSLQFPAVTGWGPRIQQGGASINDFGIFTNNTEHLTVKNSGNVGIGTTSPGSELHVAASSGYAELRLAGASGSGGSVEFYNSATQLGDIFIDASNNMIFRNTSEAFRVDSSRRLLVGTTTSRSTYNAGDAPKFQVESVTAGATVGITFNSDNANSSELYLAKARGSAVNSHTIVQNNDNLGILFFGGADGTNIIRAASVGAQVDGTATINAGSFVASRRYKIATVGTTDFTAIGASANTVGVIFTATGVGAGTGTATSEPYANSMPGRLVFSTTADGGSSPTERMRIGSTGQIMIGTTTATNTLSVDIQNISSSSSNVLMRLKNVNGSEDSGLIISANEAGTEREYRIGVYTYENSSNFTFSGPTGYKWVTGSTVQMVLDSSGALSVTGALSKGSGSFKIDHPLPEKTDTHHLVHSFIEGPQADLIYRGKSTLINGRVEINIDESSNMSEGTFVLLNREVQCFTSNETDWDAVRGTVLGNVLTIECQNLTSTATVSWLVIGERQDQHMYETEWTDENGKVIVEPLKGIAPEPRP